MEILLFYHGGSIKLCMMTVVRSQGYQMSKRQRATYRQASQYTRPYFITLLHRDKQFLLIAGIRSRHPATAYLGVGFEQFLIAYFFVLLSLEHLSQ